MSAHRLSPDDQRRLQTELFELQRRWEAWGLVVPFLFEYTDPNVQFFGAHTAQVKISRDWYATYCIHPAFLTPCRESFPVEHSEELAVFLLGITGRSIALHLSKVILRKLFVAVRRPCRLSLPFPSPFVLGRRPSYRRWHFASCHKTLLAGQIGSSRLPPRSPARARPPKIY